MGCSNSISNYQRKKAQILSENRWKSNFISIWEQYGVGKWIDGVLCFDFFKIDGSGDGQQRMSKHLRQPDLWQETQDDDLEWVHLVFKLGNMVAITDASIAAWLADHKAQLANYTFDQLRFAVAGGAVTEYAFYHNGALVNDEFLTHLAFLIASRLAVDNNNIVYDAPVVYSDVAALMDLLDDHTGSGEMLVFSLPMIRDDITAWMMSGGTGTGDLDQLVSDGKLIRTGLGYALPVQAAREMSGHKFVELVTSILDFDYKEESHWYDFFLAIIKPLLAAVALYFGLYMIAVSLMVSYVADLTDSKVLQIISTIIAIYAMDITSLESIGVSEAAKLLSNVYGLYMELSYKPETGNQEEVVDNDQEMFYKAPYGAYNQLYCYKDLISVKTG